MVLGLRGRAARSASGRGRPHRLRFRDPQLEARPAGSRDGRSHPDWSMISSSLAARSTQFGAATAHHQAPGLRSARSQAREMRPAATTWEYGRHCSAAPNDSMEYPIHAKRKPKFTKAYSFGLFSISSWTAQFLFPMISGRNEAQRGEPFAWSDVFPQFFPSTSEDWQPSFATRLASGVGNVLLLGVLSPGR
jgi:hypothetical protein